MSLKISQINIQRIEVVEIESILACQLRIVGKQQTPYGNEPAARTPFDKRISRTGETQIIIGNDRNCLRVEIRWKYFEYLPLWDENGCPAEHFYGRPLSFNMEDRRRTKSHCCHIASF